MNSVGLIVGTGATVVMLNTGTFFYDLYLQFTTTGSNALINFGATNITATNPGDITIFSPATITYSVFLALGTATSVDASLYAKAMIQVNVPTTITFSFDFNTGVGTTTLQPSSMSIMQIV